MVTVARITEKEQQVIQSEGSKPLPEIVLALSQVIHTHFLLLGRERRSEEKQRAAAGVVYSSRGSEVNIDARLQQYSFQIN